MVTNIVFIYPGQGSQTIGMGKFAWSNSSKARQLIEKADQILGYSLSSLMFNGPEEKLRETTVAQPALFVASAAALELLKERGIMPSWAAGHSIGEYSALYGAGVFSFEAALSLVQERGQVMQEAGALSPGAMAAVMGLNIHSLEEICQAVTQNGRVCVIANFNSESQIVISGHKEAVSLAVAKAKESGAPKVVLLNVSGAFHSPLMSSAVKRMEAMFDQVNFNDAVHPVFTNVDAKETTRGSEFKQKLIKQIDHSVLWHTSVKNIIEKGAKTFIEVGSGKVLTTMVKKVDRSQNIFSTDEIHALDNFLMAANAQ